MNRHTINQVGPNRPSRPEQQSTQEGLARTTAISNPADPAGRATGPGAARPKGDPPEILQRFARLLARQSARRHYRPGFSVAESGLVLMVAGLLLAAIFWLMPWLVGR